MKFFNIVVVVIIHLSCYNVNATVGRCCKKGEILVLKDNDLKCVTTTDKRSQQQLFDASSQDVEAKGLLPVCGKHSHLLQILPEDVSQVPSNACLELYHDESSSVNFPVLVYCSKSSTSSRTRSFQFFSWNPMIYQPRPRIAKLRKCCPGDQVYDPVRKFCVNDAKDITDFRMLFDMLPSLDFIDVYVHGPPVSCLDTGNVLVDFRVEQLYDTVTTGVAISMSITQSDGSLTNVTLNPETSCLDSYDDQLIASVCQDVDYCETNVCIRKCCSLDRSKNEQDKICAAAAPTFQNFSNALLGNIKSYGLLTGRPCPSVFGPADSGDIWWLNDTGEITISDDSGYIDIYNYANACLDFMMDSRGFGPMICFELDDDTPPTKYKIAGGLEIISCFFLLLTFVVYCCLPSLQNLHGKTLMCHVASLFVAYATLAFETFTTDSWIDIYDPTVSNFLCKFLGYLLLLGFHSAFFWLNVMCFDIWWTFRGIREAKRNRQTSRFLAYCTYAWGLALFLVVLLLSLEIVGVLNDVIGKERCWFNYRTMTEVVFFLLPVNLTLVVNLMFFMVTARRCSQVKAEINRAMANDKCAKNFRSDRSRLIMNIKLFVVMGIAWIFENIDALLKHYGVELPNYLYEVRYCSDTINSLQGLWIFILFVLKPKVYEALRKRLLRSHLSTQKSSSASNNYLSVNRANDNNSRRIIRKSASSTTVTSSFLSA